MASLLLSIFAISLFVSSTLSSTVLEDLRSLRRPLDFNSTIATNCRHNPSLRYCNSYPMDLHEIFRFTIVASHLCNESRNPNCVESFDKIDLRNRPKIAPLYLSFDFFWKYCPLSIRSINFANNSLKGDFPIDVLVCTQVQSLDFSHNQLSGDFPLERFGSLSNLTFLELSYNAFSECKFSDSSFFRKFNSSSFIHSGLIPSKRSFALKAIVLLIGSLAMVALTAHFVGRFCMRRPDLPPHFMRKEHDFTTSMLEDATCGFSHDNLVGRSDGVDIYRGILTDGTEARIEIYWGCSSREERQKFAEECAMLVKFDHKNLIRVLGWCNDGQLRAVITEWTGGEDLETWLTEKGPPLKQRVKILVGVMEGMSYLQELWPHVGYDLRMSSIILSDEDEPLISRFYVDNPPSSSKKTYRLGMLLLEMVTDRRKTDSFEADEAGFIKHVRMHLGKDVQSLIDDRLLIMRNAIMEAGWIIELGLACVDRSAYGHLKMDHIHHILAKIYKSCPVSGSPNCEGCRRSP